MAIQNFLSGGYYGKLGATVGQRWKNKRTIRTYVIPYNPRTEKQQANRSKFSDAVTFSQAGMQMNYYTNIFSNETMSQWNYRMKTARQLKEAGQVYLDLIPLYPISFTPPTLLTSISLHARTGTKRVTFTVPDLQSTTDRVFSLMFAYFNSQEIFQGYKLYLGYYYNENPGYLECDLDSNLEINDYTRVRIISNDDTDSNVDMIASPALLIESEESPYGTFNLDMENWEDTGDAVQITFNQKWWGTPTTFTVNGRLWFWNEETSRLEYDTITTSRTEIEENNGKVFCNFTLTKELLGAWWSNGAYLQIISIEYSGSNFNFTTSNETRPFEE